MGQYLVRKLDQSLARTPLLRQSSNPAFGTRGALVPQSLKLQQIYDEVLRIRWQNTNPYGTGNYNLMPVLDQLHHAMLTHFPDQQDLLASFGHDVEDIRLRLDQSGNIQNTCIAPFIGRIAQLLAQQAAKNPWFAEDVNTALGIEVKRSVFGPGPNFTVFK